MAESLQTATIETRVPSRLDRLPWSKFHWKVVIGLGTVWILDGLEVTMVGSVAARLTEEGSGIELNAGQIGIAAAIYIVGACLGALFFGQLTDRFGRKKLFLLTLVVYIVATVATAFAFAPWYFYLARFVTGAGIGGEYAAINSAIDELIPARARGQVDLAINGSYWLGAAGGALAAVFFLNTAIFPADVGWRLAFGLGAVLGLAILIVRRNVPESPRWLFIHGRQEEAERIVDGIEQEVREETGEDLAEAEDSLKVRQRKAIPFREIAKVAFTLYPKRAVLGLALFIGQAFIYNGITFNLGTLMGTFFGVASGIVPYYIALWALSNFLGPLLLGRLFDTVGRKPMITLSYLGSALLTVPLALFMFNGALNRWTFLALLMAIFFLASSGASAAYLTVSEVFPMETRALAIAFFYAVGTAVGGITGPLLFGQLIGTEDAGYVAIAFLIGAAVMALGGVAEIFLGVRAEQANLEDIAKPLTAEDAETEEAPAPGGQAEPQETAAATAPPSGQSPEAQRCREEAERVRAEATEHRARALELRAPADAGDDAAAERLRAEEVLADMADLRAQALDEQAAAHDLHAAADSADGERSAAVLRHRAQAAELRAEGLGERQQALAADSTEEAQRHDELAEAAGERARADEQRGLAAAALADDSGGTVTEDDDRTSVQQARAAMHDSWSAMHEALAQAHAARAAGDTGAADAAEDQARTAEQQALAAEERLAGHEHLAAAQELHGDVETSEAEQQRADERARRTAELEQRVRDRVARRQSRDRTGLRRFRPGPSAPLSTGRTGGLDPARAAGAERALDQEIDIIARALVEHGPTERQELARIVGARYWGPGRFGAALGAALDEGRAERLSRRTYGVGEQTKNKTESS